MFFDSHHIIITVMATSITDKIIYWKKKLETNPEKDIILNIIHKLSKIVMTYEILKATHIGKTIRKLSKRDDEVGEKAQVVLKKWRDVFAKTKESLDKNSISSVSKKEKKKNKFSGSLDTQSSAKMFHQNNASNVEQKRKHEKCSLSYRSSPETTLCSERDNADKKLNVKKEKITSPPIYTYKKKETQAKYINYEPNVDTVEGYNPEFPEFFPGEKSRKQGLIEGGGLKLPEKRKLQITNQTESLNKFKMFKSESHSNSVDTGKYKPSTQEEKEKHKGKEVQITNEDAMRFISSRREKTAVYSGRKSCLSEVPSLSDSCIRVLIENIDAIECLGDAPYYLLKPVLERCNATQLFNIEHYNPDLLESTNELWEIHCRRDYRLLSPQEHETWRDLYLRAHDERERKLKSVTANISASMSKSNPVRQVKMAYVDSVAKPPRDVARRQAKNGTKNQGNHIVKVGPSSKMAAKLTVPVAVSTPSSKITPKSTTMSSAPITPVNTNFVYKKPKVAPLMAKTLKSMKQCFRR